MSDADDRFSVSNEDTPMRLAKLDYFDIDKSIDCDENHGQILDDAMWLRPPSIGDVQMNSESEGEGDHQRQMLKNDDQNGRKENECEVERTSVEEMVLLGGNVKLNYGKEPPSQLRRPVKLEKLFPDYKSGRRSVRRYEFRRKV